MTELIRNIERALNHYNDKDFTAAFNFATLAIEETARNHYKKDRITRHDYIKFLRQYYWIMEPFMGLPECDAWKFYQHIKITDEYNNIVGGCFGPDIAEIVYHVFRCHIHHGKAIPENFKIISTNGEPSLQIVSMDSNNILQMSANIIIALIAVCMGCAANDGLGEKSDYYLTLNTGAAILKLEKLSENPAELYFDIWCTKNEELKFPFKDFFGKEHLIKPIMESIPRQPRISGTLTIDQPTQITYQIHYI